MLFIMSSVVSLDRLLDARQLWRGQPSIVSTSNQPTGHPTLDAALPGSGWPDSALSELLITTTGIGELRLLWPTLARLTSAGERVVLVAPPHLPFPHAWLAAGIDLRQLSLVQAHGRDALWAAEQCLRSGSCGAVLCWPQQADDRALRRLQVAAETGQTLAFAYRSLREAVNPSPAALRLAVEASPAQVRILKCRGGLAPVQPISAVGWQ
ncbi:cell division inhibitor SulA [Pseudomonas sp. MT-1]|nr:cell division inhibitor SulA [Pseudomonas sp. MT-1]